MNDTRLERLLDDVLAGIATERVPDLLAPDIATRTSRLRQRGRWLAFVHQRPLRLPSGLAVGCRAMTGAIEGRIARWRDGRVSRKILSASRRTVQRRRSSPS